MTSGVDKVLTPNVSGKIPAHSLIVRIEDLGGTVLYSQAGGIQVVEKSRSGILADQQRISRP